MPVVYLSRKKNVDQAGPTKINTTEIVRCAKNPTCVILDRMLINLNSGWQSNAAGVDASGSIGFNAC